MLPDRPTSANHDCIAANLRRLLAHQNLAVHQAAERTGLDQRTIRGILSGTNQPRARTLNKLAVGLKVSVDELFVTPAQLAHRFDRETNPAVDEAVAEQPDLFVGWTEADFAELYSRVGTGGGQTVDGALEAARAMNRTRALYEKLDVLLESGQTEAGILDVLHQRVMADGE